MTKRFNWIYFLFVLLVLHLFVEAMNHFLSWKAQDFLHSFTGDVDGYLVLVMPNQVSLVFFILGMHKAFGNLFPIKSFVFESVLFLLIAIPIALLLGRKLNRIQARSGFTVSVLAYLAISVVGYVILFIVFRI
jgi:ABC-type phosphate transport system permease subunit